VSWALAAIALAALATSSAVPVGRFTSPGTPPAPWRMVKLKGTAPTQYRVNVVGGRMAIEATVDNSMSIMMRPISVDLARTPHMCWRWYVNGPVARADMNKRSGDDYAARVYIGFDMPDSALSGSERLKLKTARQFLGQHIPDAAVVYVWDNRHPVGTARKSSYTDRSQLMVAESGSGRARSWVRERVNVASDFARAFQNKPGKPIQLAIASDGDNTNSKGRAAFADIQFVARDEPCPD
jgi:hypothetical protein